MINKNLSRNLRYFRLINGHSLKTLSQASSVSRKTICYAESGRSHPHPSTMQKLAKALGVRIKDFYKPAIIL